MMLQSWMGSDFTNDYLVKQLSIVVDYTHKLLGQEYDEDNVLVNVSNNYDIRQMGDREIPTRLEMVPQNKKGQKTIMHLDEMKFNTNIDDHFFSQQNMKKLR